jgi:hypothetical protein
LSTIAALIEIDPDDPTNAENFAVLRGLLARRVDFRASRRRAGRARCPEVRRPDLHVVLDQ